MNTPQTRVITTGLMLFALFFGAGNLIFPPVIGAQSGPSLLAAVTGFLLTGVLLPAAGVVAVASSGQGITGLAHRLGVGFGIGFPTAVYLAIGPCYAIPRVATVSYELATRPLLAAAGVVDPRWGLVVHSLVFFAVSVALAFNPSRIADRVGRWLTPALLALILLLCALVFIGQQPVHRDASDAFAAHAFAAGITRGYFTMDALASIVFGIVVIDALRGQVASGSRPLLRAAMAAGLLAAALLGLVYAGLAVVGTRVPGDPADGAGLLLTAARRSLGGAGLTVFAAIVLLACLTTAIGLLNACASYAVSLVPRPSWQGWLLVGAGISLLLANLGLEMILFIVGPLTMLLYPMAIALIVVTLLNVMVPGHLRATYFGAVGVAGLLGAVAAAAELGFATLSSWLAWLPSWDSGMGWLLPAMLGLVIGLAIDAISGRLRADSTRSDAVVNSSDPA